MTFLVTDYCYFFFITVEVVTNRGDTIRVTGTVVWSLLEVLSVVNDQVVEDQVVDLLEQIVQLLLRPLRQADR